MVDALLVQERRVAADAGVDDVHLIAALALRWGYDRHPDIGNTTWFEVAL